MLQYTLFGSLGSVNSFFFSLKKLLKSLKKVKEALFSKDMLN